MSTRNRFAVLVLAAVAVTFACGGGEKQETQAPPPAAGGAGAPPAAAGAPAAPAGDASISGKVSFTGTVPPAEKIKLSADPKCVEMHKEGLEKQPIKVKDGGLADVYVYVKSGLPPGNYPAKTDPVTIDQHGCNYTPHIVALETGQPLKIKNSDDTLHNIHPRPTINDEFNIGQPRKGMESTRTFTKREVMFPVGCDVHPWMRAYISVLDNPFYTVTSEDGTFEIKGLPAGDYEIEAYHEKLKTMSQKVSVKSGEKAKLDFAFKG
jgi:polysaccharide lyase family 4-like protein